jgi:hypothetical protein
VALGISRYFDAGVVKMGVDKAAVSEYKDRKSVV